MTDRENRVRIRLRTAEKEIQATRAKLREALVDGANTSALRRELETLGVRLDQAEAELAGIAEGEARGRARRLTAMSAELAGGASESIRSVLDRLRPPAPPKPTTEEDSI